MNKRKQMYLFASLGLIVMLSSFVYFVTPIANSISSGDFVIDGTDVEGFVCVQVTRADGTIEPPECSHNQVFNGGLDHIRDYIGQGTSESAFTYISLCNATGTAGCEDPVAAASEKFSGMDTCGMSNASGTYGELVNNGNWSIYKTFTSTCDAVEVNVTRLSNGEGTNFSGNSFTLVTLQTDDQVTINWTITAS